MGENIKKGFTVIGIILLVFCSFFGWYTYETEYKITFLGREESADDRTAVIFQMRGEPGGISGTGTTNGRIIVKRDEEEIKTIDFQRRNGGKALSEDNWIVDFYPAGVEILLWGDEDDLPEQPYVIFYSGAEQFEGYSEEEIVAEVTARYDGEVSYLGKESDKYSFQADGFTFFVNNDLWMTDDYEESCYGYLAQQFSYDHNRITEFEKSEDEKGNMIYIPIVSFHGRGAGEAEAFSNACCDLVEGLQAAVGFEKIGYFSEESRRYFDITPYLENYDRMEFYNAVYQSIERDSLEVWQYEQERKDKGGAESSAEESAMQVLEEMPGEWKNYEADCFYRKKDGTELRMVGVDRAAGSSYYAFLEAENGVNTSVVSYDPYLGNGGYARWIDFLEDEKTGFSCLAYSGGSLGSLYRTEDGGRSFQEITYPSAEIKLPDGSLYNPFIMPDKIWEEGGKLYMMAGQGPDGDYYEDGSWVYGLYESEDAGKNWRYTGTVEGEDYR